MEGSQQEEEMSQMNYRACVRTYKITSTAGGAFRRPHRK
jgi:hypothetical protein